MPNFQKSSGQQQKEKQADVALPPAPNLDQEKLDLESRVDPQAPLNGDNVSMEVMDDKNTTNEQNFDEAHRHLLKERDL